MTDTLGVTGWSPDPGVFEDRHEGDTVGVDSLRTSPNGEGESELVPELFRAVNDRIRELGDGWALGEYNFVCECVDDSCTRVLRMTADQYAALRDGPDQFAVLPGHQRPGDVVVSAERGFLVVSLSGLREPVSQFEATDRSERRA
jgi:hypothetical protein